MSLSFQDIRNEIYKQLGEYSPVTGDIDVALTYRVDNLINRYYCELAEREKVTSMFHINHFPVPNLLDDQYSCYSHYDTAINVIGYSAFSYWFETNHSCYVDVQENTSNNNYCTLATISVSGVSMFTPVAGFVTANSAGNAIRLQFYGTGYYQVRNVGMYAYTFEGTTASIPDARPYTEYTIPSNYFDMKMIEQRNNDIYENFTDYKQQGKAGGKILISRDNYSSEFVVHYYKQPSFLSNATDTFEIQDKTVMLIPPAVAGMILKGNGLNLGAGEALLNEYDKGKSQIDNSEEQGMEDITNYEQW